MDLPKSLFADADEKMIAVNGLSLKVADFPPMPTHEKVPGVTFVAWSGDNNEGHIRGRDPASNQLVIENFTPAEAPKYIRGLMRAFYAAVATAEFGHYTRMEETRKAAELQLQQAVDARDAHAKRNAEALQTLKALEAEEAA